MTSAAEALEKAARDYAKLVGRLRKAHAVESSHLSSATASHTTCAVLDEAADAITALRERVARLEGALKPFALYVRETVADEYLITSLAWTTGEHRRARAALTNPEPGCGGEE